MAAALTASYVLYGFDTAGTLAEGHMIVKAPVFCRCFAGLGFTFCVMAAPDLGNSLGNINGGYRCW
jgi:hypothetical protein